MVTTPSSLNTAEDLAADLLGEKPPGGEAEGPFRAPLGWDWMAASYILPPSPWVRIVVICYLPPGQTGSLSQKVVWRRGGGRGGGGVVTLYRGEGVTRILCEYFGYCRYCVTLYRGGGVTRILSRGRHTDWSQDTLGSARVQIFNIEPHLIWVRPESMNSILFRYPLTKSCPQ